MQFKRCRDIIRPWNPPLIKLQWILYLINSFYLINNKKFRIIPTTQNNRKEKWFSYYFIWKTFKNIQLEFIMIHVMIVLKCWVYICSFLMSILLLKWKRHFVIEFILLYVHFWEGLFTPECFGSTRRWCFTFKDLQCLTSQQKRGTCSFTLRCITF